MDSMDCGNCFVLNDQLLQVKLDHQRLKCELKNCHEYIDELNTYTEGHDRQTSELLEHLKRENAELRKTADFGWMSR